MMRILAWLVLLFGAVPALAQSGGLPDNLPKVQAALIAERAGVAPGGDVTVALKEVIRKDWHTYWRNPGDSGAPTAITWHLPPGWHAGPLQWPYPAHLPVGPLMNFGYENEVALLSVLSAPADARPGSSADISADVSWLVCNDVCIPENTRLNLRLAVSATPPPANPAEAALFAATRAHLPRKSPWAVRYDAGDKRFALQIGDPALVQAPPRDAVFYPYDDGMVEAAAPQRLGTNSGGLVLESIPGYKLATRAKREGVHAVGGVLLLTPASGAATAYEVEAQPGPVAVASPLTAAADEMPFAVALAFAFLGGLILNLMPCVFPVLSMKALALAAKREHPGDARRLGLAYGAGVMASFLALAGVLLGLRSAGAALGWGFQLQQPVFVAALALLMFAIGLNLSGLFEIRLNANVGTRMAGRGGAMGSFFTGVLAVLVATPCTAPFMGAAAGYALAADAPVALGVFAALGLGFATPFAGLAFAPAVLKLLPRPGAWMTGFRQLLAFPMYGAAIWLTWVLTLQSGAAGMLALLSSALLLGFALWLSGRAGALKELDWVRCGAAIAALVGAIFLVAGVPAGSATSAGEPVHGPGLSYEPFSAAKLVSLQESGRPVFVNATAAWCITCLVNERLALSGPEIAKTFADHNVAALKADWTTQDPAITALLARHGRSGVPLYLYFPPHAADAVVLPQLLTESTVIGTVARGG